MAVKNKGTITIPADILEELNNSVNINSGWTKEEAEVVRLFYGKKKCDVIFEVINKMRKSRGAREYKYSSTIGKFVRKMKWSGKMSVEERKYPEGFLELSKM